MHLMLLTEAATPQDVLPALALLDRHSVVVAPARAGVTVDPAVDVVLVDARRDPDRACRLASTLTSLRPILVVAGADTVRAVGAGCAPFQLVLCDAGPAELDTRLRLAVRPDGTTGGEARPESRITVGALTVDVREYRADVRGRPLGLTRREFELLAELAAHPGRTLTRRHLLWRVWGPDYTGGARTVDVHVRALRAALGPRAAAMVRTVRGSGYMLVPEAAAPRRPAG